MYCPKEIKSLLEFKIYIEILGVPCEIGTNYEDDVWSKERTLKIKSYKSMD